MKIRLLGHKMIVEATPMDADKYKFLFCTVDKPVFCGFINSVRFDDMKRALGGKDPIKFKKDDIAEFGVELDVYERKWPFKKIGSAPVAVRYEGAIAPNFLVRTIAGQDITFNPLEALIFYLMDEISNLKAVFDVDVDIDYSESVRVEASDWYDVEEQAENKCREENNFEVDMMMAGVNVGAMILVGASTLKK